MIMTPSEQLFGHSGGRDECFLKQYGSQEIHTARILNKPISYNF
jgi:hypothetical protein